LPKDKRSQWTPNRIGDSVRAMLYVALRQVTVLERPVPHLDDPDKKQVILIINPSARGIDISNFTVEELDRFKQIIDFAIELARPICAELDEETRQAALNNDMRYKRLWRAAPRYVEFPRREERNDNEELNSELPGVPDGSGDERKHGQGLPSRP
jgi:hypothetical protein